MGSLSSIKDMSSTTDEGIINEVTTNITGPMILARHLVPRLLAKKSPTNFLFTSSGLAYVPNGHFPIYCASKAYVHHFMVAIRQTLQGSNVNVIEIVPPFVRNDFLAQQADMVKNVPAMTMQEFTDGVFEILDNKKAEDLKEVAAGTAKARVEAWRSSIGAMLVNANLGG